MIIDTITNEYHFAEWLAQARNRDSSYGNSFTDEGAKAVQAYFEELSEELNKPVEFDPIAWCVEFSEYDSLAEACKQWRFDYTYVEDEAREYFQDNTTLIELDNGHVILGEF